MKPVMFVEHNAVLARPSSMTGEECESLPVYKDGKQCISCWEMSWKERLSALIFGKSWIWVLSGDTQPPIASDVTKTIFK